MSVSINAICRKDRINQSRTTNIYLRFTVNRRSRYVSTGINIPADDWDFDTQTLKTQNPAVQLRIYEQIGKYDKRIKRLEALEVPVTLDNVLETDGRRVYCTIAEYFRRTIAQLESVGKIGSASKHKVTFSLLQQFRSTNIRFDEITVGYLRDFELFLMKKGNKSNSIATKFSVLKAVYNKALAEGIFTTPHSPFLQFKIGRLWTATRKRAIRKEDVQRLMQSEIPADGSAYLDFARDIFLFSYLSAGINFKDIADLYTLEIADLLRLERWADKSARNLMASLEESKQVPFERVLYGLGIRFVGETVAKRLVSAFHSMEQLEQASFEDLTAVDEIGERIARSIIAYFADERNRTLVNRLKEYGLQMSVPEEKLANRSEKLKGLSIVISGTFAKHSRDEYKAMIEQHGGKNSGSVSGKTDYILAGDNMGPAKLEKAAKLGVKIINEDEFLNMIAE